MGSISIFKRRRPSVGISSYPIYGGLQYTAPNKVTCKRLCTVISDANTWGETFVVSHSITYVCETFHFRVCREAGGQWCETFSRIAGEKSRLASLLAAIRNTQHIIRTHFSPPPTAPLLISINCACIVLLHKAYIPFLNQRTERNSVQAKACIMWRFYPLSLVSHPFVRNRLQPCLADLEVSSYPRTEEPLKTHCVAKWNDCEMQNK